ncbi:polysaccharide biosynthesis tyrosine autokinase [Ideonella sp. B7]|uniref:GumC family protein n=1 Tax=Ideonella benzenivorans TaxID=2831643 RepID=UPI001CED4A50|nr:polysaccharide biosynthesis tyrosine autokinase [Ideonella benzenivorans]MCA6218237.1 polysaccharide biosynthesis tyrosine autokinase [Ideonella benzenivorans]
MPADPRLPAHPPTPGPAVLEPLPFQPLGFSVSDEQKVELLELWRSISKRKWPILGLAAAAAVVVAAVALALTPVYRSTSTVLIEPGKGKILSIQDVYEASGGQQQREYFQTQVEILKSRDVAVRTIQRLKLWEHPEFDPRKNGDGWSTRLKRSLGLGKAEPEWTDATLTNAVMDSFMAALTVEPVRLSQLVKVSFDSTDPRLAPRVANELAHAYIDADRESKFAVSQQASIFLQERLGDLQANLAKSEQALQDYRESKGIVSLEGSAQTLASQQAGDTTTALVSTKAHRLSLQAAYDQVRAVTNGNYVGVPWVMRDAAVSEAQRQVNDAQRALAQLQETLGPRNQKVLQAQAQLDTANTTLQQQSSAAAKALVREYQAALATEQSLDRALGNVRSNVQTVNREEFQLASLQRDVDTNRQLYDMFMSRAKETDLAGDVQASVGRIVDPAVVSDVPVKPKKAQMVSVAFVLALLGGALVSMLLDKLDNTVKGGEDAETRLRLPLLTALPVLDKLDHDHTARLFLDQPDSHHAEAIRTARTGVLLSHIDLPHKSLLVTSTVPGEGKTTLAINLALAHAAAKRTLLVDVDMRRPQVGPRLNLPAGCKGLSNLVAGTATLQECLHTVEGSPLLVLPVGDIPPNPLELLLSQRFKDVLKELGEQFEIVVLDSPPVELVSEALVLAPLATSTILVVKALSTPAPLVRKSIARLQRAGASMLGVVVNHLDFGKAQRYHGQYGADSYGYGGYGGYGTKAGTPGKPQPKMGYRNSPPEAATEPRVLP